MGMLKYGKTWVLNIIWSRRRNAYFNTKLELQYVTRQ